MIRCRGIFLFTVQQEIKRLKCLILSGHLIISLSIGRGDSMGYTTEFIGKLTFNREPSKELKDYINCFAKTWHFIYAYEGESGWFDKVIWLPEHLAEVQ